MTALHKKINKLLRPSNFAVTIGENSELVAEISKIFRTVFVYLDKNKIVKAKNVIYREKLENGEKLAELEAVFLVDNELANHIRDLHSTIMSQKPAIIVFANELPSESICKWIGGELGYNITHEEKKMYVWTRKK
jgi:DNA primase large subunit